MATDKKLSELPIASAINASDSSILVKGDVDYQFTFDTLLQFISEGLSVGANITFGSSLPPNNTGKNGDVFINTINGTYAQKTAGVWVIVYNQQPLSSSDGTVLYGTNNPGADTGKNNDTYINTISGVFYKKSANVWTQVFSMQTGPAGASGPVGPSGPAGINGKTILSGTGDPSNLYTGNNGDYYINTANYTFFGPKTNGIWPNPISLVPQEIEPPVSLNYPAGTILPIVINDFQTNYSQYGNYPSVLVRIASGDLKGRDITASATIDFGVAIPPATLTINASDTGTGVTENAINILIKI